VTLRRSLAGAALLTLVALVGPASAQGASPPSLPTGGILDGYSRVMFSFNRALYARMDQASAWWAGKPAGAVTPGDGAAKSGGSLGNVVANLVNEPVTAVTALVVGDIANSWRSVERFAINSTAGVLGYYDTATGWGYGPTHTDPGLSLCKAGVGEGPYLVLPFIGPRTVRDAVSDVVLTNAVLWTAAGSLFGTGASVQTIVIAESVEIVADIVATRQIDPQAKALGFADYDATRDRYLAQRRARCAALRGETTGQSG